MRFWHILYSHVNMQYMKMSKLKRASTLYDQKYRDMVGILIAYRKHAGLTQSELAARVGVSQPDISKIERFERKIDALELIEWIRVFSCGEFDAAYEIWKEIYEKYCKS